jgi:hypothetical protein
MTPDDGKRHCPKHVEFHFQNKFEKLVHLVGFIIRKPMNILSLTKCRPLYIITEKLGPYNVAAFKMNTHQSITGIVVSM